MSHDALTLLISALLRKVFKLLFSYVHSVQMSVSIVVIFDHPLDSWHIILVWCVGLSMYVQDPERYKIPIPTM